MKIRVTEVLISDFLHTVHDGWYHNHEAACTKSICVKMRLFILVSDLDAQLEVCVHILHTVNQLLYTVNANNDYVCSM